LCSWQHPSDSNLAGFFFPWLNQISVKTRSDMKYTALIRTYNSLPLVAEVVAALRAQAIPPDRIIAVDSNSELEQRLALDALFDQVIDYPPEPFNYSKAINIGVEACKTDYVLIISSHVLLNDPYLISYGINHISSAKQPCLGCCFNQGGDTEKTYGVTLVNKRNFSLLLGLSNSCALLKKKYITDRPFLEDVFSAEDQEWAAYYLRNHDASFFSFHSIYVKYQNQHMNELKTLNEFISMAYFTHRELRGPKYILPRLARSLFAFLRNRPERAKLHMTMAVELFLTNFRKPVRRSAYYGSEVIGSVPAEMIAPNAEQVLALDKSDLAQLSTQKRAA
jgi:glycosyltransferase involved in cell wall biosynthesis